LLVSDPEGVQQVLLTNAANYVKPPKQRRMLEPLMGRSLLTTEGGEWQRQRRLAAPAFRQSAIAESVPDIVAAAENMTSTGRTRAARGPAESEAQMRRLAFEIIGRARFGGSPGRRLDPIPRAGARCQRGTRAVETLVSLGLLGEAAAYRLGRRLARITARPI